MANLPPFLLQETITVQPYLGASAYGADYGPSVVVKCMKDDDTRLMRNAAGEQVISTATVYCAITENIPIHSRVQLASGLWYTAISSKQRNAGRMPTPNHLEVMLQ